MLDYKWLRVAAMIWATLINTNTNTDAQSDSFWLVALVAITGEYKNIFSKKNSQKVHEVNLVDGGK